MPGRNMPSSSTTEVSWRIIDPDGCGVTRELPTTDTSGIRHCSRVEPSGAKRRIARFRRSNTRISPIAVTKSDQGEMNSPGPGPSPPMVRTR